MKTESLIILSLLGLILGQSDNWKSYTWNRYILNLWRDSRPVVSFGGPGDDFGGYGDFFLYKTPRERPGIVIKGNGKEASDKDGKECDDESKDDSGSSEESGTGTTPKNDDNFNITRERFGGFGGTGDLGGYGAYDVRFLDSFDFGDGEPIATFPDVPLRRRRNRGRMLDSILAEFP